MTLAAGARLGSYEIAAPLGAGGMGEVYRATQTSLGRQVAIKILAGAFAADAERLRRFEQEAQAASGLNHPNIISIYDVGRDGVTSYIAMEFVDGKTLRALLEAGPIGIKKSLQIAAQIADGLARAHAAGIVHRDLKPENVMVTRDGFVKILDFGLAKLAALPGDSSDTMTAAASGTHPGTVMGTVGYMSPEQARGSGVDFRSDIFSFGSVLYEMITGKKPFKGDSSAQTLAAIIEEDPEPISESNPKTPVPLRWIIERCLAKDPVERYASTRDLASDLYTVRDHLSESGVTAPMAEAVPLWRKWLRPVLWTAAGVALGAALAAFLLPRPVAPSLTIRTLTFSGSDHSPSVSPDGSTVAFVSTRDGSSRIWLKHLESGSETAVTAGPVDHSPRFSPDGAWILFLRNNELVRIPPLGGEPRKLLDDVDYAEWSPDGRQIVFIRSGIEGSKANTTVGIAAAQDGSSRVIHRFENQQIGAPSWSPDGRTIALVPRGTLNVGLPERHLVLMSSDGKDVRNLDCPMRGGAPSDLTWANSGEEIMYGLPESGAEAGGLTITRRGGLGGVTTVGSASHVLLQNVKTGKARVLFAVQAPLSRLEIVGPGRVIYDSLSQRSNLRELPPAPGHATPERWLTRGNSIDRQPFYSPDGEFVLFSTSRSGDVDLWDINTKSNSLRRLTDHPAADWDPYLTPDGKHLLWSSNRSGHFEVWVAERDGSAPRQLTQDGFDAENPAASPDGWVVYASTNPQKHGLWKIRLDGTQVAQIVAALAVWPDVSPDGKFALYHIVGTNLRSTIAVVRMADGGEVNFTAEGSRARFSRDGRSIIYLNTYLNTSAADIVSKPFPSEPNAPVKILVPASPDYGIETFSISPDGKRIVTSFTQPSRSLVIADGVPSISPPIRSR